jgi:tetratricopeptide (TPR) repeat protein
MNQKLLVVCFVVLSVAACRKDSSSTAREPHTVAPSQASTPSPALERPTPLTKPQDRLALEHRDSEPVDHLVRCQELRQLGDHRGALMEAQRALFDDPEDAEALTLIAKLAETTGKKEVAVEALERLAKLDKDDPRPLERQSRLLISLQRYDEAVKAGQQAIARDSEDPDAYQVTGRALLAQRELASAIRMFERVIELSPDHGYAWNNLGFAYLLASQNDDAVDALTRAAELLPDVAYVQNSLGLALERVGRLDEAMRAFATATDLSPKYVKAKINLQRLEQLASTGEMPEQPELEGECSETTEDAAPE